jgi:hypothetical protein
MVEMGHRRSAGRSTYHAEDQTVETEETAAPFTSG